MAKKKLEFEKVPLLTVYKEGEKIKFRTTRNITNFELYGFLSTYIKFLEIDLARHMGNADFDNAPNGSDNFDEFED